MYNHKTITSNDAVRKKFQLQLYNQFDNLQINEDDTVQTAYDMLEQALNEAASNSLPKTEKYKQALISTQSLYLIEQQQALH